MASKANKLVDRSTGWIGLYILLRPMTQPTGRGIGRPYESIAGQVMGAQYFK